MKQTHLIARPAFCTSVTVTVRSSYQSPAWLYGAHAQTIYPALFARKPAVLYARHRLDLPDQDFIDIDFLEALPVAGDQRPFIALFHGLEGDSSSHYARALMAYLSAMGLRGAVVHWRGCSGSPNRLARSYHSGESGDIDSALHFLAQRLGSNTPLFAVGVSLGGNALIKWLGEDDRLTSIISAACAVSAPHDLEAGAQMLASGISRLYTHNFMSTLKAKSLQKLERFAMPYSAQEVKACTNFHSFDDIVTARVHGFKSAQDYWTRSSCKQFMATIKQPTLVINAVNDPFLPPQALARQDEVSALVTLEYPAAGGHVGFLSSPIPGDHGWIPKRAIEFFGLITNKLNHG